MGEEKFDEEMKQKKEMVIRIIGDNAFYSQKDILNEKKLPLLSSSFKDIPFCNYLSDIKGFKIFIFIFLFI